MGRRHARRHPAGAAAGPVARPSCTAVLRPPRRPSVGLSTHRPPSSIASGPPRRRFHPGRRGRCLARRPRHLAPRRRAGRARRRRRGTDRAPSCGEWPWRRRSAPGSAARSRSRSSRPCGRRASISRRASPDRSAMRAPVPAALPAGPTRSMGASGHEAEDEGVQRVDLAPEGAGELDLVDRSRRRDGPSAAARRRRARPSPAGSRGRRSG